MRNALGLMLASVGAAVVIAAVWFGPSPRADSAVAAPVARRPALKPFRKPVPTPRMLRPIAILARAPVPPAGPRAIRDTGVSRKLTPQAGRLGFCGISSSSTS
jgi:hypothetical protein